MSRSREEERRQVEQTLADAREEMRQRLLDKHDAVTGYLRTLLNTKYPYSRATEEWHVKFSSLENEFDPMKRAELLITLMEIVPASTSEQGKMLREFKDVLGTYNKAVSHQQDALAAFDMRTEQLEQEKNKKPEKEPEKPSSSQATTSLSRTEKLEMIKELKSLGFEVRNPKTEMIHLLEPFKKDKPGLKVHTSDIERIKILFVQVKSIAENSKEDKMVQLNAQAAIAQECRWRMSTFRNSDKKDQELYQSLAETRLDMLRKIASSSGDRIYREEFADQLLTSAKEYSKGAFGAKKSVTQSKDRLDELSALAKSNPDNKKIQQTANEAAKFLRKNADVAKAYDMMTTKSKAKTKSSKNPIELIRNIFRSKPKKEGEARDDAAADKVSRKKTR